MSSFIIRMLSGERPVIYGTGEKRRDYIYVDDVNDFHLLVLEDPRANGRVFNVGSGINFSVNEIHELIDRQLKTGLLPAYEPDLPGEAQITLADIAESRGLGWRPKVGISEGLKLSIEYIRDKA
jgi:UDP-glucose 4-epimerase